MEVNTQGVVRKNSSQRKSHVKVFTLEEADVLLYTQYDQKLHINVSTGSDLCFDVKSIVQTSESVPSALTTSIVNAAATLLFAVDLDLDSLFPRGTFVNL